MRPRQIKDCFAILICELVNLVVDPHKVAEAQGESQEEVVVTILIRAPVVGGSLQYKIGPEDLTQLFLMVMEPVRQS